MNNEQFRSSEPAGYEPCDPGVYRTGSTKPPKRRGGLIAVLLVAVILLFSVITVLGIANIRLFEHIKVEDGDNSLPAMFTTPPDEDDLEQNRSTEAPDAQATKNDPLIDTNDSPTSVENRPVPEGLSLQQIYQKNIPSVVSISCSYYRGSSTGTGVILTQNGYIVTNSHVVEDANSIQVLLTDGRILQAELVGADTVTDLAVLHIPVDDLTPAEIGDSSVLQVGDTVVAIGDPLGIELRGTMTDGIVSAINRDINVDGRTMNLIQTNAALNSGNSGGPLINCYGQVVGINTMKMGDSMSYSGVEGLGFAIPSTVVTDIVNQLISKGYVSGRPDLGIQGEGLSTVEQIYYQLPRGLYITHVEKNSSADQVGIQPGDILISLDGAAVTDSSTFETVLYTYHPGDKVNAIVYRGGHHYEVPMIVGEANS